MHSREYDKVSTGTFYPLTAVHVVDRSKEGWGLMAVLIALMVGTTCGLLLEARRREMFKAPRPAKSFS